MDCSEAHLDIIESQKSTDAFDEQKRRSYARNLINKGVRILSLRGFSQRGRDGATPPPLEDTESEPEFLSNLRLSDLYNLPGEHVLMTPEIFSSMRAGNKEFLGKMKSYETPMACFKNDRGDSILHLAASLGHLELVKGIVSECPSLLLEPNWKGQIPLHVAARAGHSAVIEALVASVSYFSAKLSEQGRERLNAYVVKDIDGDTPLHSALKHLPQKPEGFMHGLSCRFMSYSDRFTRQMEIAACLVNANQNASFLANKDGKSPLYLAAENGNVSLVNAMLKHPGNNVQGKTSNLASQLEGTKSLIHAALKAKNTDVLDVILLEDPSLVKERDEEGRTCLSVGASVGYYKGICKLLDRSTSYVYEWDDDGSFPIHVAVANGHWEVVKELLKRCPDSKELLNKQGQNILHIAAKSMKSRTFSSVNRIMRLVTKNHMFEEQDVDGNTPLHLATIKWRPRFVTRLIASTSAKEKLMNIRNKDGLRALDIAELKLQSDYVFRERMTLMVLLCAYAPKGVPWLATSGMTLKSRSEHLYASKYKDHITALLLVATIVATITFAAGFTLPGGYFGSDSLEGTAVLATSIEFSFFLVLDTVAMQSSVIAIVSLIWAQLGDPELVHRAFHLALPALFVALLSMSWAFAWAMRAVIWPNELLSNVILALTTIFLSAMLFLLSPYVIPQVPGVPVLKDVTRFYLLLLLFFVNEDDAERGASP